VSVPGERLIELTDVSRRFGPALVLDAVSLNVPPGRVHALLGRNGAGKTTLLRIVSGLVKPTGGSVRVAGVDVVADPHAVRGVIGVVPSGDRSFYLRLSGYENLLFFARLRGYGRRGSAGRVTRAIESVGLGAAARQRVGTYSHGMQKQLSIARALIDDPPVLLVDEATHDLDPEWASEVRRLAQEVASGGAAILWTTQRVEEVRGFADELTLLDEGRVRFAGTVAGLLDLVPASRYVLGLRNGRGRGPDVPVLPAAIGELAPHTGDGEFVLTLRGDATLGDALGALLQARLSIVSCRQETPEVEEAFMRLLGSDG